MYHQVWLDPSVTDMFGFAVEMEDGELKYFKYLKLPFGTSTAGI
jgi:hypothetical protein